MSPFLRSPNLCEVHMYRYVQSVEFLNNLKSDCWLQRVGSGHPGPFFFLIPPLRLIQHEPEPKYGWLGHWNSLVCTPIFSTNESGSRGFHVGSLFLTIPHLGGISLETVKAPTSEPIGVLKLNRTRLSATKQLCFDYPSKLQLAYPSSYSCTNLYRSCHSTGVVGSQLQTYHIWIRRYQKPATSSLVKTQRAW